MFFRLASLFAAGFCFLAPETFAHKLYQEQYLDYSPSNPPFARLIKTTTLTLTKRHTLELPPFTRIIRLEPVNSNRSRGLVGVFHHGKVVIGTLDTSSFSNDTAEKTEAGTPLLIHEKNAFFEESDANLSLAAHLSEDSRAEKLQYTQFLQQFSAQLACVSHHRARITDAIWTGFKRRVQENLSVTDDRVETLERFKKLIFSAYNPTSTQGLVADRTLLIPLSMRWIESNAALASYFDQFWIHGNFDMRFYAGMTGEGISHAETSDQDEIEKMNSRLQAMRTLVQDTDDAALNSTPEAKWLNRLPSDISAHIDRMIFLHRETWNTSNKTGWMDFVPADHSFGPLASAPVLGVVIHEINVNSNNASVFPADTHSRFEDSANEWRIALETKNANHANASASAQALFIGRSPFLGSVINAIEVSMLAESLPCGGSHLDNSEIAPKIASRF